MGTSLPSFRSWATCAVDEILFLFIDVSITEVVLSYETGEQVSRGHISSVQVDLDNLEGQFGDGSDGI